MRLIILILFLITTSCTIVEEPPLYVKGDSVYIKPNNIRVIIDQQIPGGYIVYSVNKFYVNYFVISYKDILK